MDGDKDHLGILFDNETIRPIDYVKEKTDFLNKFKENEIIDIKADCNNKLYILLNNGLLYINDKVIDNISYLYQMDYVDLFAITFDKKIISLNNNIFQDYFGVIKYDKIITYLFGIVTLYKGEVKICLNYEVSSCIDYQRFINVEDIDVNDEENEVYIKKNGKWIKLFIN